MGPLDCLKRDLDRYNGSWMGSWGAWAVVTYRLNQRARQVRGPLRKPLTALASGVSFLMQGLTGVELPASAEFGAGLYIPHGGNIVVHPASRGGQDCVLMHGTTLGATGDPTLAPTLGDRVAVLVNASVIGAVRVGDDAVVGGHALVLRDVPAGASVGGVPARLIGERVSVD